VGGVDVRGSAPGTRETDLLQPTNLVEKVHGVLLSGGSAFGLDAATGVMRYLEERRIGYDVGVTHVPIVPAAIIFDLGVGDGRIRPDAQGGYRACEAAGTNRLAEGNVGAGAGATVGKLFGARRATIGVVATDAVLTKVQAQKIAQMAHNGLARSINPVHTMSDGDTLFALGTGKSGKTGNPNLLGMLGAEVMARAVVRAVRAAQGIEGYPGAADIA
jgi:L-aminopeptidase/D-esterase-like protein